MNPPPSISAESLLDEAAAEWLLEREEGFAPGRAEAFAQWRDRDSRHAQALVRVERTLALLNELPAVDPELQARVRTPVAPIIAMPAESRTQWAGWRWASGLAAALVIGATVWWTIATHVPAGETYLAGAVEPRRVALADGTVVDLNANSRLLVNFTKGERQVTLSGGEAHFRVAHDTSRPFIVTASGVSVRAVGTAFNVRMASGGIDVVVVEGKVKVARGEMRTAEPSPEAPLVTAGERTQVSLETTTAPQVEKIDASAMHALLAWQDRMTSFTDVPLRELVSRINRCNSTQLILADVDLGERRMGGVIALTQIEAFVKLLEQDGDIVAVRRDGEITLRRAH